VRGISQREGVDYDDTFYLVSIYTEKLWSFEVSGNESHIHFAVKILS
jgi:hypothetical protein